MPGSYRGITLSSVIAKTLEIILLQRLYPALEERGFAYQKGIVLLQHLYDAGINGKCWRVIKNWYSQSTVRIRSNGLVSDPFVVGRGVKQGSVLSPSLFLIIIIVMIGHLRDKNYGTSLQGFFLGAAVHADDVRTVATNKHSVMNQASEINSFTQDNNLNLNTSKLEIIRISQVPKPTETLQIVHLSVTTSKSAKCLGVWWSESLSAKVSIAKNIAKARKAFFAFGSIGAFQGKLNPLSSSCVVETCVIPILLYGCEIWLLDSTCLSLLESFQCEIGRRILQLSKHHSNNVVRIGLHWPSVGTRILLRKLAFLGKLLSSSDDTMSTRVFTTLAIDNAYDNISVVQQCRMLEVQLGTNVVEQCLQDPDNAFSTFRSRKNMLLKQDFNKLLLSALNSPSAHVIASIASQISWRKLWDLALDRGVKGTYAVQGLLRELSRPLWQSALPCL